MPNWCENELSVYGSSKEINRFYKYAKGKYPLYKGEEDVISEETSKLCLNKFISIPKNILKQGYGDAGYNWQMKNWGIKWYPTDVTTHKLKGELVYKFTTPWEPLSRKMIESISKKFPKLQIILKYAESGGYYSGIIVAIEGRICEEEEGEYGEYYGK